MAKSFIQTNVDIYLDELSKFGLRVERRNVEDFIRKNLSDLAKTLGVSDRSVRRYLTEEIVRQWARDAAAMLADERPGSDMLDDPDTVAVLVSDVGRILLYLTMSLDLRIKNDAEIGISEIMELLAVFSSCLMNRAEDDAVQVPISSLTRSGRMVAVTGNLLENGEWEAYRDEDNLLGEDLHAALQRDGMWIRSLVPLTEV
jgi:hypothetical protein